MKYKEGQTVVLKIGFYDEHDRKYIPKNAEGHIVNVLPVLGSYQIDFTGYALVMVPEEMIVTNSHDDAKMALEKKRK